MVKWGKAVEDIMNKNKDFYEIEYINLGFAISYYRKRAGMTQKELASKIGISRQHLGAIEAPKMIRAVSLTSIFLIAEALNIEPYKLLKFSPESSLS